MMLNKIKTRWRLFTQSILYLPILFAICTVTLFLITSRLDELYYQKITFDIPYLRSFIFAGSTDAARSVLSTIAAGWATILGVAFSVTLITLQLSITKYTSHLVNRFEGDKINQLTLGWFIAVVIYSLLVLKTIRASDGEFFTPIIGVNIAVVMAIISLFIFVLFLKNISSYLRPNILVANVTNQILSSLRKNEERIPDNKALFAGKPLGTKIIEMRSRRAGVLSNINWRIMSKDLDDLAFYFEHQAQSSSNNIGDIKMKSDNYNSTRNVNTFRKEVSNRVKRNRTGLRMDLTKSIGESVRKNEVIATVYSCGELLSSLNQDQELNGASDNGDSYTNPTYKKIKKYKDKILSSLEITQDRRYDDDPLFGIELLRSLAIKSAAMHDTDVVKSTVTGLFKILSYALRNEEISGVPFYINPRHNKIQKYTSSIKRNTIGKRGYIVINPKEGLLVDVVKSELSIICNTAVRGNHLPIIAHFINEYVNLGSAILELTPPKSSEIFARTADWFSQLLHGAFDNFPDQLKKHIKAPLTKFTDDLNNSSPQASRTMKIYFKNIIDESN